MVLGKDIWSKRDNVSLYVYLGLLLTFCFAIVARVEANEELKEKSRLYAARFAANVVFDDLPGRQIDGVVNGSTAMMLENIQAHSSRANSEVVVRRYLQTTARQVLERELELIQERFMVNFSGGVYSAKEKAAIEAFLSKQGMDIFKSAREAAVDVQLNRVTLEVYPTEKQVMDLDASGWSDTEAGVLKQRLAVQMHNQELHLFDEVKGTIDARVDQVYRDIQSQMSAQREALSAFQPDSSLVTQEQITDAWIASLEQVRQSLEKDSPAWQMIYPPFPSIAEEIGRRSAEIEPQRFREYIIKANLGVLSVEQVAAAVRNDRFTHKRARDGLAYVVSELLPQATKDVVDRRVSTAPEAYRSAYRSRIEAQHLPKVGGDIRERVKAYAAPVYEEVRQELAEHQLQQHFPALANWSWELVGDRNEVIVRRWTHDGDLSVNTIRDCLSQPILDSISPTGEAPLDLIEETESEVLFRVKELLNEAGEAWDGQIEIYNAEQKYIRVDKSTKIDLKSEIGRKTDQDIDELVEYFMRAIKGVWDAHRIRLIWDNQQLPEYRTNKYLNLFFYIREEIESRLRQGISDVKVELRKKLEEDERVRHLKEQQRIEQQQIEQQRREQQEREQQQRVQVQNASLLPSTRTDEVAPRIIAPESEGPISKDTKDVGAEGEEATGKPASSGPSGEPGAGPPPVAHEKDGQRGVFLGRVLERIISPPFWVLLLILAVVIAILVWGWRNRRKAVDTREKVSAGLRRGLIGWWEEADVGRRFTSLFSAPDRTRTVLVMLVLLQLVALVYLLRRDLPNEGPLNSNLLPAWPVQVIFDNTRSEPGVFVYTGEGYLLRVTSPSWRPPDEVSIEVSREKP